MKTIFNLSATLFFVASFGLLSCSSDNDVFNDENQQEEETKVKYTDLSSGELANCYIVTKEGNYKFKADNQFNLGEGLPVPPEIAPVSAELVWQSEKNLISDVMLSTEEEDPYVVFQVKKAEGNAVIAVYNEAGDIEWSWHIWMPLEEPSSILTDTGYELMNMNLGALYNQPGSANSYGMLYQWGRKDPFPAAATITGDVNTLSAPMYDINNNQVLLSNSSWYDNTANTLSYSISHPTVVLSNYSHYTSTRDWLKPEENNDNLWGNPLGYEKDESNIEFINKGKKTCYDPSPAGWRVAPADVFMFFTPFGGYAWDFSDFNVDDINRDGLIDLNDYNYGWHFMINSDSSMYFPAAARFDGSYAMLMGSMSGLWGNYWSNSPAANMIGGGYCALAFQVSDQTGKEMISVSASASSSKADAFSIRCVRDN